MQLAEGDPTPASGPLRLGVTDIVSAQQRLVSSLDVEPFELYSRPEIPVQWGTFSDPWGNRLGFFEHRDKAEKDRAVRRALR